MTLNTWPTIYFIQFSIACFCLDILCLVVYINNFVTCFDFIWIYFVCFHPVSLGLTIIICVCNIAIWRNFQRESVASQHRNGASRNRRLSKTLLLVSILALVCWLPLIIMDVLIFLTTTSIPNNFYYMVNILNYSNSFVNPIVYVFRIPEFQQALRSCSTKRRPAIKIAKFKGRNRTAAHRTPEIELRILRNDPSHLQVEVELEYMETKL